MVALRSIICAITATGAAAIPLEPPSHARSPAPTPSPRNTAATVHIVGDNNAKVFQGFVNNAGGQTIVTTPSGGSHSCGGATNNGQLPGGSPAAVLASAAKQGRFAWDATWDGSNFAVRSIGKYANSGNATWALYVDNDCTTAGQPSCDTSLNYGGNTVWWVYNPPQYQHFLYLHHLASSSVNESQPFTVTVTDRLTGKPVQGASIQGASPQGATTDENGNATIDLPDCGPYNLRAKMDGSLDSNWVYFVSDPYGRKRCV